MRRVEYRALDASAFEPVETDHRKGFIDIVEKAILPDENRRKLDAVIERAVPMYDYQIAFRKYFLPEFPTKSNNVMRNIYTMSTPYTSSHEVIFAGKEGVTFFFIEADGIGRIVAPRLGVNMFDHHSLRRLLDPVESRSLVRFLEAPHLNPADLKVIMRLTPEEEAELKAAKETYKVKLRESELHRDRVSER